MQKNLCSRRSIGLYFLLFCFFNLSLTFSQERLEYYLELKEGVDLGVVQTTFNPDETLTITTNLPAFSSFINSKSVYKFQKAFPHASHPVLAQVYLISLDENTSTIDIHNRSEVEKIEYFESNDHSLSSPPPYDFPNDYDDIIFGGRNTSLDLVNAPLAWSVTTGNENGIVGISDYEISLTHEELVGKIDTLYVISTSPVYHGTGMAGIMAARTNNVVGISSLGYNTTIVGAIGHSVIDKIDGMLALSAHPGVKVINCSWIVCDGTQTKEYLDNAMEEVASRGVLVVAGAGNGDFGNFCYDNNGGKDGYCYPASYDEAISVTSVGHLYPIGEIHPPPDPWEQSWKDVHEFRPHNDEEEGSHTHNDKVDACAPGILVTSPTANLNDYPTGYRYGNGTSLSTAFVSALAALVFDVNPNFTAAEVKNIIESTTDNIYDISYNTQYLGLLGTGRINAYRAVQLAECLTNPTTGLDLAMQNSYLDVFDEPDANTEYVWRSEDIWVRNQNDGKIIKEHENPEYDAINPNYVYVRVTNNSCETSLGTEGLQLSWAKANSSLIWPDSWDGTQYVNGVLMGDEITTLNIPILEPGESTILEFEWYMPNPADYATINSNDWHFCLLARIKSLADPMTYPEGSSVTDNVTNNNNIAWKNITIVDIDPGSPVPLPIGGVVGVGNPFSVSNTYNLVFAKGTNEPGKAIYDEAEVTIEMDDVLYDAWVRGGSLSVNMDPTWSANKKIIGGDNAVLENIQFYPNEYGTLYVTYNFLTKELTNKEKFIHHVIQKYDINNEIIGGETFEINKIEGPSFFAEAGDDEEILKNETITITAEQINEAAVYNWYDPEGNLIYTGIDLTVAPNITQTYKLEVISDNDGYKDYDDIEITVNPYYIESLAPNPVSDLLTVNYMADEAVSAYLMIINTTTGTSDNYILDTSLFETTLDLSVYPTGLYSVSLVCDGVLENSKMLVIE